MLLLFICVCMFVMFVCFLIGACDFYFCGNGGTCVIKDNEPSCDCSDGFKGEICEQSKFPFFICKLTL